jgi:hypothetical protein
MWIVFHAITALESRASAEDPAASCGLKHGQLSVNFNSRTILLAAENMNQPLPADQQRALDAMLETALRPDLGFGMTLRTGDLQLLNNYAVPHSRTGRRTH